MSMSCFVWSGIVSASKSSITTRSYLHRQCITVSILIYADDTEWSRRSTNLFWVKRSIFTEGCRGKSRGNLPDRHHSSHIERERKSKPPLCNFFQGIRQL